MKKIVFVAGGVLIAWGAYCWYKQDQKKQKQVAGTAASNKTLPAENGTTATMQEPSPARLSKDLQAELIITDEPVQLAPLSQAVQYFDNNGQYYRPRTTLTVDPQLAQDVITIDSANMYAR